MIVQKVCIPNIIQIMLVSFIPDAFFPGSSPVILRTSVGVAYSGKQLSDPCVPITACTCIKNIYIIFIHINIMYKNIHKNA